MQIEPLPIERHAPPLAPPVAHHPPLRAAARRTAVDPTRDFVSMVATVVLVCAGAVLESASSGVATALWVSGAALLVLIVARRAR